MNDEKKRNCEIYQNCVNTKNIDINIGKSNLSFIAVGCWGVYCQSDNQTIFKYKKKDKGGKLIEENVIRGQKEVSESLIQYTNDYKISDMYLAGDNIYQIGFNLNDEKAKNKKKEEIQDIIQKNEKDDDLKKLIKSKIFDIDLQLSEGFNNCFKKAKIERFFVAIGNHDIENCDILNKQINSESWNFPSLYYNVIYHMQDNENNFDINIIVLDTNMFEEKAIKCNGENFSIEEIEYQKKWAQNICNSKNRWNIIIGHIPYLANGHKQKKGTSKIQNNELSNFIKSLNPDLYICADEHNQQLIQDGNINIVIAGSGGTELDEILIDENLKKQTLYASQTFGFVSFDVSFNEIKIKFISSDTDINKKYESKFTHVVKKSKNNFVPLGQ